jgi:hypothetical protein
MIFLHKNIAMKSRVTFNAKYTYLFILLAIGTALYILTKDLFFFDEDIFVASNTSDFLNHQWQRSLTGKLSYKFDHLIWGTNPFGYHFTNIVLHLINAVLALLVLKQLLEFVSAYINAFQSAAVCFTFFMLFLITPVHSEPLNYILARIGLVVTFFSLLSILFFLKANFKNKFFLTVSILCFLLALFSYEVSWTVPFIILAIIIFTSYFRKEPVKKDTWLILIYFLIFTVWFTVKVVVIDKMEVSDYKDEELFGIGFTVMLKNASALLLRNFLPPFKNSITFLSAAIIFIFLFLAGIIKLYINNRKVFYLCLLLIVITVLGFAATVMFGIDSHDSESERYIYFSSVFAIMLLSVMIVFLIKPKPLLIATVIGISSLFLFSLVKTIKGYNAAGRFAKTYLQHIDKNVESGQKLFFINMPSQHEGALMFRAKSRIGGNTNDKVSVMQEYLNYLYNKTNLCITLSNKELIKVPQAIIVVEKPADNITTYFPEVNFNKTGLSITTDKNYQYNFEKGNAIIALKDSVLYFFK